MPSTMQARQSAVIISDSRLVPKRRRARAGLSVTTWSESPRLRTIVSDLAPKLGDQRDGDRREHQHHHEQHDDPVEVVGPGELHVSGRLWASRTATRTTRTLATEAANESSAGRGDRDGRSLAVPAEERRVERDPAERGRDRQADRLDGVLQVHQRDQRQPGGSPSTSPSRRRRRTVTWQTRARSRPRPRRLRARSPRPCPSRGRGAC